MSLNYKAKRTGLKGFFLFHSEKVLLVLAFVALAAFFALGYGGESFDSSKTPDALKTQVEQVKSKLKVNTWETVAVEPERVAPTNHARRAKVARTPVSDQFYVGPVLDTPIFKELVKRTDPDVYPPEQIEVAVAIGAVAQRTPRGGAIQDTLADAVDPEIEAPRQPRSRNQRGAAATPYGSGGEMMMEGSPYGAGPGGYGDPNKPTVKQLTPYLQQKFQKDYYTISAKANLKGAYVVAVKAVVPLKRQNDEFERTFKDATGFNPANDRPEVVWFEAERAEVTPGMTEDQLAWELVSNTEIGMEQARMAASQPQEPADPRYLLPMMTTFPIPPMVMAKLKDLGLHSLIPARKTLASSRADRQAKRGPNGEAIAADGAATGEEEKGRSRGPKVLPRGPAMGGSGSPYGDASSMYEDPSTMYGESSGEMPYGDPSMMYGESGGDMYGASPYGASPYGSTGGAYGNPMAGVDYKLVRFFDFEAQPGKTYRYRVRLFYRDPNNLFALRSGAGTAGAAGAAGAAYGAAGGEMAAMEAVSSYAGSGYGPGMGGTGGALKEYMLAPEVLTRLNSIPEEDGGAEAIYYRTTEWSAPSEDVVVPFAPEKRFAGAGEAARRFPLPGGGDFPIALSEPHAKIAVSRWDNKRAVDVPTEIDARRGTVLNKVGDVDVLHPLLLAGAGAGMGMGGMEIMGSGGSPYGGDMAGGGVDPYATEVDPYSQAGVAAAVGPSTPIRRLAGYNFRTDSVVLDIRGGEKLPGGDPRNPMNSPTLALMVDRFGNLEFASEVEDAEGYRDTLFIDPTPEKKAEAAKKLAAEAAAAMSGPGGSAYGSGN
ncbi:MAG TPA: hypothetical protein VGN57_13800 [Pirellulaceae bacterium]|jgi:hypothetical protein|nr:hypothetical protein [Pirellulaceae bacterium]